MPLVQLKKFSPVDEKLPVVFFFFLSFPFSTLKLSKLRYEGTYIPYLHRLIKNPIAMDFEFQRTLEPLSHLPYLFIIVEVSIPQSIDQSPPILLLSLSPAAPPTRPNPWLGPIPPQP